MPTKTEARAKPQPIAASTLATLPHALAQRVIAALGDRPVTAAGVQRRDEVYLAVRVAGDGADLLGHVRLVATLAPAADLASIRNSIPTDDTVVALAKFEHGAEGADATISATEADDAVESALAAIDRFIWAARKEPGGAYAAAAEESPANAALTEQVEESIADRKPRQALTSGATAVEAAASAAEGVKAKAKAKRPRKSRPKSNISISRGERK